MRGFKKSVNTANGSWWFVPILSTKCVLSVTLKSFERQLVDGSDPFCEMRLSVTLKSHQRQLVDGSDPFDKMRFESRSEIPPTAVGGSFRSFLQKSAPQSMTPRAENNCDALPKLGYQRINWSSAQSVDTFLFVACRKDLNHPPTAVGGIFEWQ